MSWRAFLGMERSRDDNRISTEVLDGGQGVEGVLALYKRQLAESLLDAKTKVEHQKQQVEALALELDRPSESPLPSRNAIESLLTLARTAFESGVRAFHRAQIGEQIFRHDHGIPRDPVSPHPVEAFLILGLLVFADGAMAAGFFYGSAMAPTLTSALTMGTLVATVNVVASALCGYLPGRYLTWGQNAEDPDEARFVRVRTTARAGLVIYLVIIGVLHLTVGQVRATESWDQISLGISALVIVFSSPSAVLLVVLNACMSVAAWLKGKYAFSDPYGGYGRCRAAVNAGEQALEDVLEDFSEQIEDVFDEAQDMLDDIAKARSKAVIAHNKAAAQCRSAVIDLEHLRQSAESAYQAQAERLHTKYQAAGGRKKRSQTQNAFSEFVVRAVPILVRDPDDSALRDQLHEQKAAALADLRRMYQSCVALPSNETGDDDETENA